MSQFTLLTRNHCYCCTFRCQPGAIIVANESIAWHNVVMPRFAGYGPLSPTHELVMFGQYLVVKPHIHGWRSFSRWSGCFSSRGLLSSLSDIILWELSRIGCWLSTYWTMRKPPFRSCLFYTKLTFFKLWFGLGFKKILRGSVAMELKLTK